ncbi:MAG: hypothetical protein WD533_00850 [Dehalococcoidia bacterium]
MQTLTPHQTEIARALVDDVLQTRGGLFTVEMAEGAGVHEISAQVELLLLTLHVHDGGRVLKVTPELADHTDSSPDLLADYLREGALHGLWSAQPGRVRLGIAECRRVTPQELLAVSGPLAQPFAQPIALIEVLEAQRLDRQSYERYLAPLAAASGATVVLYGTPWNGETLFEELKQRNREAEAAGGRQKHFRATWEAAADESPDYRHLVNAVRERVGEHHPEFQTRYALRPVQSATPLLSTEQVQALMGTHQRQHVPSPGTVTRASVVVTRLPERASMLLALASPDAVAVVTLAEETPEGVSRVLETRWVQAADGPALAKRLAKLLGEVWRCGQAAVDLGLVQGEPAKQFRHLLEHMLGPVAIAWQPAGDAVDSRRLLALIAAANTGRLSLYAMDGSPEYRALRHELESAVVDYGLDAMARVRLPHAAEGFLRGLSLLADDAQPRTEKRWDVLTPALAS